jgi:hypothetical protein
MAFVVAPAAGAAMEKEHERMGAPAAVPLGDEEAIGSAVQGAAQKTLFGRLRGFRVRHRGRDYHDDDEKRGSLRHDFQKNYLSRAAVPLSVRRLELSTWPFSVCRAPVSF